MTGKKYLSEKEDSPPVNQRCVQRAARINATKFRLTLSVIKEILHHCRQNLVAKRQGRMLPVRFGNLYDVRERSEVRMTSSTGGSERPLGFCVLSSPGQNVFESWGYVFHRYFKRTFL